MAQRRMFSPQIVDSDAFLDMSLSAQNLYFHLGLRADDDGFVGNPRKIQRLIGGADDDFRLLLAKRFVLPFESGVIVIKHWRINNYIRKDRYKETCYLEEKNSLRVKENGAYTLDYNQGLPISGVPWKKDYSGNLSHENKGGMLGIPVGIPLVDAGQERKGKEEEKSYASQKYLEGIPKEDIEYFKSKLSLSDKEITDKAEDLLHYCLSKGRKYKNYRSFLLGALKRDFKARAALTDIRSDMKSLASKMKI